MIHKLTLPSAKAKSWGAKSSDLPGYDEWAREQVSLELGRDGGLAGRARIGQPPVRALPLLPASP